MLIPALDFIDGQIVRLYQGDYNQVKTYAYSPYEQLCAYVNAGATWLHLVDLSGAKNTEDNQRTQLSALIKRISALDGIQVQIGGGIRSRETIEALFAAGAARVVIGSMAVSEIDTVKQWLADYGNERIVLALDVNIDADGKRYVATEGWQQGSEITIESLLAHYAPVKLKHVLCTDISRDGTLSGSNTALYQSLAAQFPHIHFQASGGIGSLDDIKAVSTTGVNGVILGRALLEGKFSLEEGIACWQNALSLV